MAIMNHISQSAHTRIYFEINQQKKEKNSQTK